MLSLFARRGERRSIIEKLAGLSSENSGQFIEQVYGRVTDMPKQNNSLRNGLLLIGVGLGLVVGILLSDSVKSALPEMEAWEVRNVLSLVWVSCAAMFGGLGLLLSALIELLCKRQPCDKSQD